MSIFAILAPDDAYKDQPVRNTYGYVHWARPTRDGIYDRDLVAEIASALSVVWFASQSDSIPLGLVGGWTVEVIGDTTEDWADVSLHVRHEGVMVAVVILDGIGG